MHHVSFDFAFFLEILNHASVFIVLILTLKLCLPSASFERKKEKHLKIFTNQRELSDR